MGQSDWEEDEIEEKLFLDLDKIDPKQIEVPEISKFSSLKLENDPAIIEAKLEAKSVTFSLKSEANKDKLYGQKVSIDLIIGVK